MDPLQQLEGIRGRPGRSPQDADHERAIVLNQLGQGVGAVVRHLQEERPLGVGDPGQGADDGIVDERRDLRRLEADRSVGVEHLEEVPDAEFGCLQAEGPVCLKRRQVVLEVVVEGHRVEDEVAERRDGREVDRAERSRRQARPSCRPGQARCRCCRWPGRRGSQDIEDPVPDERPHRP